MKNQQLKDFQKSYKNYCKTHKLKNIEHTIVKEDYEKSCIKFYADKRNVLIAKNLCDDFIEIENESLKIFENFIDGA